MAARRFAGASATDESLEDKLDSRHVDVQRESTDRYSAAMQNSSSNPDTREFEALIRDARRRQDWFADATERGLQQVAVRDEQIEMDEQTCKESYSLAMAYEQRIDEWKVKEEEKERAIADDEDLQQMIQILELKPSLASLLFKDEQVQRFIRDAINGLRVDLEAVIGQIKESMDSLRQQLLDQIDSWELPQKLKIEVQRFQALLDTSQQKIDVAEEHVKKVEGERDDLLARNTAQHNTIQETTVEHNSLLSEAEAQHNTIKDAEAKYSDLANKHAAQKGRIEALGEIIQEKTNDLKTITLERDEHRIQHQAEAERARNFSRQLEEFRSSSEDQKNDLQERVNYLEGVQRSLEETNASLVKQRDEYSNDLKIFRDDRDQAQKRNAKLVKEADLLREKSNNDISNLKKQLSDVQKELQDSKTETKDLQTKSTGLQTQLQASNSQAEGLQAQVKTLEKDKKTSEEKAKQAHASLASQIETLNADLQRSKKDGASFKEQVTALMGTNQGLKTEIQQLRDKVTELEGQVTALTGGN
ncbi:MAG: hypothetical protein L6R41_006892 [Letrouitia leprolyta]|nr:MAG: hypothetical protein L6R41_006892 [Letrouitia leprolyta]